MQFFIFLEFLTFGMGCLAWTRGLLTRQQADARQWSKTLKPAVFLENGGMWSDSILLSPLTAIVAAFFSQFWANEDVGWALKWSLPATTIMIFLWGRESLNREDSFGKNGWPNDVGFVHWVYMATVLAIMLLFYFATPKEQVTWLTATTTTILLMFHIAYGTLQPPKKLDGKIGGMAYGVVAIVWSLLFYGWWRLTH